MLRRRTPLIIIAALTVVAVPSAPALTSLVFGHTQVRTHRVAGPVREIVVTSSGGDVDLIPSSAVVAVRETRHYVKRKPELDQGVHDGVLTLDAHCGGHAFFLDCYSDLRVGVPAGVKVTVDAGSGDVDARGVDVRAAQLRSDSGDVVAQLAGRQGLVWARSDSGDVDVEAPDATAVDAQTDSGDVKVQAGGTPRRVSAQSDSGGVEVAVPRGDYAVEAATDSGKLKIEHEIARNDHATASILAKTDSGDVRLRGR